jgi:hypothetical protein
VGAWSRRIRGAAAVVVASLALLVAACFGMDLDWSLPGAVGQIWDFGDLGRAQSLVPGDTPPRVPAFLPWTAYVAGAVSIAILLAYQGGPAQPAVLFLATFMIGQYFLMALLWLGYDRYTLVLVPFAIGLLLAKNPPLRIGVSLGALALVAAMGGVGVRDHLRYNAALWRAAEALRDSGVPVSQIDAGYVVNGWWQYADPPNAPRNAEGKLVVRWVNSMIELSYRVSGEVPEAWTVLEAFDYDRWLGPDGRIYVLKRPPENGRSAPEVPAAPAVP